VIVEALLALITGIVDTWYELLPDWTFLDPFEPVSWYIPNLEGLTGNDGGNPLQMVASWASKYNTLLPIQEAYALLLIYLGLQAVLFTFQGLRFALNVIRGSGA